MVEENKTKQKFSFEYGIYSFQEERETEKNTVIH